MSAVRMRRTWLAAMLWACGLLPLALASAAAAADSAFGDADRAIAAGREAFADGRFPWYNRQTDALQPLTFRQPRQWKPWNLSGLLRVTMWTAIAIVLAILVVLLVWFLRSQASRPAAPLKVGRDEMMAADHVEALAFLAERPRGDLLGEALRHYEQGNYSEAIIYLFSYQLLQLDKSSLILLAKGKTNRQYLREASRIAPLRTLLEQTMCAFEGVFFGRRSLDRAGFEACWNQLPQFEQHLRAAQ